MEGFLITDNEKKILRGLARDGPQNQYQLSTKTGIRYATVQLLVKRLAGDFIIEGKRLGEARTGLPKIEWHLRNVGFCMAIGYLQEQEITREEFDKVMNNWKQLIPLMKKWDLFKEKMGWEEAYKFVNSCPRALDLGSPVLGFFDVRMVEMLMNRFKQAAISKKYWENRFKEHGLLDRFFAEAKSFGLESDFGNVNKVIACFLKKADKEDQTKIGNAPLDVNFYTYGDAVTCFIGLLEDMRDELTLPKWVDLLANDETLGEAWKAYVKKADEAVAEEVEWMKTLAGLQGKKKT